MGLFDQFPYTNFHELNLDWILNALKELEHTIEQFVSINALKYADPIQWNITKQYEKNTIVIDPLTGTAYISVQPVPNGVSLTNTDYWTVVFDLGSFVTRAAKNFTLNWESQWTQTATFPSPVGAWLVWNDTLYKVISNIVAGDMYVIDSNIKRFTMEEYLGHIEDLTVEGALNLVNAINLVYDILLTNQGDLDALITTDKSNLVAAINEVATQVLGKIGDLDDLITTDKSNLVAAINENVLNIATLPHTFRYNVAQIFLDGTNGSDDNSGLTADAPMQSIEAVFIKYGRYGYINLHFIEPGSYNIPERYIVGHATCFMNESSGDVHITGGPLFYFGGHVELHKVIIDCDIDFRAASIIYGRTIDGVPLLPTINGKFTLTECSLMSYGGIQNKTIYLTGCNAYFNNITFTDNITEASTPMISANFSKVSFNTIEIVNNSNTYRFLQAFNGCDITFTAVPTLSGAGSYAYALWMSSSNLYCSRDVYTAFINFGGVHSTGTIFNIDGYAQQINVAKRPVIAITSNSNLNDYVHGGSYQCTNSSTAASLTNSPISERAFNLYVLEGTDPVIEQVVTVINTSVGNTMYRRRRSSSNIWGPWEVYLASELAPASNQITSGNDLNNFMTAGVYNCQNSTIAATLSNSPVTDRTFKLTVNQVSSDIIYQEIIVNSSTYTKYVRARSSGGTWGAWATINTTNV